MRGTREAENRRMVKYIEIDRAIETALLLLEEGEDEQTLAYNAALVTFVKNMENQPSADVAEVRHGRWIEADDFYESGVCSVCKWNSGELHGICVKEWHYCPNCGASMQGEEK